MKLTLFKEIDFLHAVKVLFKELKVPVNYVADEPTTLKKILSPLTYKENYTFNLVDDVYFVGMVDDAAFAGNQSLSPDKIKSDYDGILIFGITLHQRETNLLPTRSQLAEISRAFNREFYYTPVVLVFKYHDDKNEYIAFANTERLKYKQEWREGEKAGKVSLLRDINIENPHRGHEDIVNQLKIPTSGTKQVDSFSKLYNYWQEVFSVSILNKKFYQELSNWYFWAIKQVRFPNEPTQEMAIQKGVKQEDLIQEHNATNVIRLLTRLLFTWFIKEKKLIPDELFDIDALQKDILNNISPYHEENSLFKDANKESIYYKAILQNLFFATLNCPIEADKEDNRTRGFRGLESYGKHRGIDWMMRYKKYFKNPDAFLKMVNNVVPFLNGGLFECLDDKTQNLYIDGFSDQMTKGEHLIVPDYLFFGATENVDLSAELGVKNKQTKQAAVKGLINILKSYKFTITENTPIEEDVALDPELLGKVFENLLASYNPETKTTARKQTGSFYTPREIVNYMVDESLIAYLKSAVNFQFTDNNSITTFQLTDEENSQQDNTFFNPNDEIQIHEGNLPHWAQKNVWYFITFRLADSIPKEKVEQLKTEREQWLKEHKKEDKTEYSKKELKEYYKLFSEKVENWLNARYGSCVLNDKKNAEIVADALKYFEGKRYILDEWVVMPNHVHVLVKPIGNHQISDILHSWKSFTSNEINKNIGRTGQLWMHESYDHIVRNEKAFKSIKNYIRKNPEKAHIVSKASGFGSGLIQNELQPQPNKEAAQSKDALDTMLHQLTSFDNTNPFAESPEISKEIVYALDWAKILDPAAGSGAFPMGILQKMVHILKKLDPTNELWKEVQLEKALAETKDAYDIEDKNEREQKLIEINNAFDEQIHDPDFARKLYLIENCIYGVDIQPIATQISKLRFFISLVVDQKVRQDKPNFGIRPLPNLETKFVTANTLIGLDKPEQQLSIFDSPKVRELEQELKLIRHKLFSAKTKTTKLKYRQRDEELRNKIAEELQKNGWENNSAKQLASWDPYDQNASSPFFDPEWMFDIKEGFDVVIGNPPYKILTKNNTDNSLLNYYLSKYIAIQKSSSKNLYTLFIECAISLLNKDSQLSFIVPEGLYKTRSYKGCVELMEKSGTTTQIITFSDFVFENAVTGNLIFLYQNTPKLYTKKFHFDKYYNLEVYIEERRSEIDKIEEETIPLKDVAIMFKGMVVKDRNSVLTKTKDKNIFLLGKNISKWKIESCQYTDYNKLVIIGGTKKLEKHNHFPRILVRRTGDTLCCSFLETPALTESTLYSVWSINSAYPILFLYALLNSKLLNHYNKIKNITNQQGFPQILMSDIELLPIKKPNKMIVLIMELLSKLINFNQNIILENVLDSIVYNLYFPDHMKERGIAVLEFVERDINEVMQGGEFEQLSDTKKEQVIEQLHQKWTDPDNEVVKRMGVFKEKSPDILKVIMES